MSIRTPGPRTDCAGLADLSDRRSHALALQTLNGLSFALTIEEPSCLALPDLMRSGEKFS
jgi:hypothetical protein